MKNILNGKRLKLGLRLQSTFTSILFVLGVLNGLIMAPIELSVGNQINSQMITSLESFIRVKGENDEVGYALDKLDYVSVESGKKSSRILSEHGVVFQKTKDIYGKEAEIFLYSESEAPTRIIADEAQYKLNDKILFFVGNVRVEFPDGFWLETTSAVYRTDTRRVFSDDRFYGEQDKDGEILKIWGVGFWAERETNRMKSLSASRLQILKKRDQSLITIVSDQADFNRVTRHGIFTRSGVGELVESRDESSIVWGEVQEAFLESSGRGIKKLIATRNVRIEYADTLQSSFKYAVSQYAEFFPNEDRIMLTQLPIVYQNKDRITGDLIYLYPKRDLVDVRSANAFSGKE